MSLHLAVVDDNGKIVGVTKNCSLNDNDLATDTLNIGNGTIILHGDGTCTFGGGLGFGGDGTLGISGTWLINNNGVFTVTGIKVGANAVLGAQGAAVANATDAGSAITQLNLVLARLRAHGLIAT